MSGVGYFTRLDSRNPPWIACVKPRAPAGSLPWIAQPGERYIEIQGGLAQTQGDYVAMPAGAKWSWLEAYGLIEADATKVHSKNWSQATATVALWSYVEKQD